MQTAGVELKANVSSSSPSTSDGRRCEAVQLSPARICALGAAQTAVHVGVSDGGILSQAVMCPYILRAELKKRPEQHLAGSVCGHAGRRRRQHQQSPSHTPHGYSAASVGVVCVRACTFVRM